MSQIELLLSIIQFQEGRVESEFMKLPYTYTLKPREVRLQISSSNTILSYL